MQLDDLDQKKSFSEMNSDERILALWVLFKAQQEASTDKFSAVANRIKEQDERIISKDAEILDLKKRISNLEQIVELQISDA